MRRLRFHDAGDVFPGGHEVRMPVAHGLSVARIPEGWRPPTARAGPRGWAPPLRELSSAPSSTIQIAPVNPGSASRRGRVGRGSLSVGGTDHGHSHHARLHADRRPRRHRAGGGAPRAQGLPAPEAYGGVDELNAVIGLARVFNAEQVEGGTTRSRWLDGVLRNLQNELFDLGSELATPEDAAYEGMFRVGPAEVTTLERADRRMSEGSGAAQVVHPPGGRTGQRGSCIRPARCAGASSAKSWRSRASSRSATGRSST